MKNTIIAFTMVMGLFFSVPALAATPAGASASRALGRCLVGSLNGKERTNLAKWIFFSMGAHPDIKGYLKVSPKTIDKSDQYIGHLITRLLTVDCPKELHAAYMADPMAVRKAFGMVGQVAMQELMTNQAVRKALTNYGQYTDREKIAKILGK